jgi:4-hydroxy-tetrahydrodipicolinate reductase
MLRIAVSGAKGRMGSLVIDNVMKSEDMELCLALDVVGIGDKIGNVIVEDAKKVEECLRKVHPDVLIDFTVPDGATKNVKAAASCGVCAVVGTTGFSNEQFEEIKNAVEGNIACIISPNFSIGVNVFLRVVKEATRLLKGYDIEIVEAHHRKKIDAPSGTAKRIVEIIKKETGASHIVYGRSGVSPRGDEICVHAIRGGDIVGDHTVIFAGDGDRIELRHQAHSRNIFAIGAVKAARWIVTQQPGLYSMDDFLSSLGI